MFKSDFPKKKSVELLCGVGSSGEKRKDAFTCPTFVLKSEFKILFYLNVPGLCTERHKQSLRFC